MRPQSLRWLKNQSFLRNLPGQRSMRQNLAASNSERPAPTLLLHRTAPGFLPIRRGWCCKAIRIVEESQISAMSHRYFGTCSMRQRRKSCLPSKAPIQVGGMTQAKPWADRVGSPSDTSSFRLASTSSVVWSANSEKHSFEIGAHQGRHAPLSSPAARLVVSVQLERGALGRLSDATDR